MGLFSAELAAIALPLAASFVGGAMNALTAITFAGVLAGGVLLVMTPARTFEVIIAWPLLFAFVVIARQHRPRALAAAQAGERRLLEQRA